jgi:hypothetical protein
MPKKKHKDRNYFELLTALRRPGCPVCELVLEDSRRYLDSLMYERVLDVPMRVALMDSFGLCSWHTWQLPALPAICSPATGFSIFASDLLRKFDRLVHERIEKIHRRRVWQSPLRRVSGWFLSRMKVKACPACVHGMRFETYYLKDLVGFVGDEEFLQAYRDASGICLPHFFSLVQNFSALPNFDFFAKLHLSKAQFLRATLDEFVRKQDHRFRKEITSAEAKAWRVAMEFLAGKPGVFNNEMRHEGIRNSQRDGITAGPGT